jgi:hypothetical protein
MPNSSQPNPRLWIFEGVPGSGKTTSAQYTADWLARHAQPANLYLEGNLDHPADFESVACLNEQALARIDQRFPQYQDLLRRHSENNNAELWVPYQKMRDMLGAEALPDPLFQELARYEIYNGLSAEDFQRLALLRWQLFSSAAAAQKSRYVFECCFLQNPITNLLGRHNRPRSEILAYLQHTTTAISGLTPAIIYLDPGDIFQSLQRAVDTRPAEWYAYLTWYVTQQAFGLKNHLQGLKGIAHFYEAMREIQQEFFASWKGPLLYIQDASKDWPASYRLLEDFLSHHSQE